MENHPLRMIIDERLERGQVTISGCRVREGNERWARGITVNADDY